MKNSTLVRCARSVAFALTFSLLSSAAVQAGVSPDGLWRDIDESSIAVSASERLIIARNYRTVEIDLTALAGRLEQAPMEFSGAPRPQITLPFPDGSYGQFAFEESPVMEPALAAQFPEIRTYRGQGLDDPSATTRFDWTPFGFHAMILSKAGRVFIDPYRRGDTDHYISYFTRDEVPPAGGWHCDFGAHELDLRFHPVIPPAIAGLPAAVTGATVRTYRLALAADGEYTAFYGGTVSGALSGMTTTVNRVVGIYEVEVAVHMNMVAGEASIIYTNPATDPYTNNDGFTMLSQNQTNLDSVIGSANYDIGHVFSTGGGGIAGLGVVCQTGQKAQGVTGSSNPIGDGFDVDYVAHEMGHEFGANHTFNGTSSNCGGGNRNASTAYEPGSGSTIMAYAGICGPDDLQPHSDPYFHTASFDEIVAYTTTAGLGDGCAVKTATGNLPPAIDAGADYTIPMGTPFLLTAAGSDPDGDPLSYCWEEFDLGAASPPNTDNGNRPLFRSFNPTSTPSRMFPKLASVLTNTSAFPEILPTTTRTMKFRVTARDNRAGGGGVSYDLMQVNVKSTSGPFTVTAPNTAVAWAGGSAQTVSWNVAGTSGSPVNCANVNIFVSADGGNSFPYSVAAGVPNNGSATIAVPNISTTTARVMVAAAGNIFFDISDVDFTITATAQTSLHYYTLAACRVVDTRRASGPDGGPVLAGGGATRNFPVTGVCSIPSDASAVTVNITAVNPSGAGDLRFFAAGTAAPSSSVINFRAGRTRANNAVLSLAGAVAGAVTVQCDIPGGSTHMVLDVTGYFK